MTKETDLRSHFRITVVDLGQNVETYPSTQRKVMLILKMGYPYSYLPPGCSKRNNAKPFIGMVHRHKSLSEAANRTVIFLIALRKNDKN